MENDPENIRRITRTYFLQHGQSIKALYDILESNLLVHHLKKWSSILLETILYLLFVFIFLIEAMFPTDIPITDNIRVSLKDVSETILILKVGIVIICFPLIGFARTLRRNRLKNEMIQKAFNEVKAMKEAYDKIVRELNLI